MDEISVEKVIASKGETYWDNCDPHRNLKCPICADLYQHVSTTEHVDGNDNYEAGWGGRGDLVKVSVWGECGSEWEMCIGFHKGFSMIFVRVIKQCE